ncbi:hypothetical protein SAMN00017405_2177 [Desulfonispora thiosulfatigenes DSM 11270]|uniref:Uncharacterized protein n=1 Tax=Desulfonispora thiosulfatigenes DSM 11270 TaxID=656914 RepID=A0A1W1ULC3_DESTI|nr:hypothetical protein [Desulfonispora thiosulfatigenes]SMB81823.1 hypothetical protein SAMN00017405_2177 [Desulfonispora thiosulfatigenes DSM 11270]
MHTPVGFDFFQFIFAFLNIILLVGFVWVLYNVIFVFPKKISQIHASMKNMEEMLAEIKNNNKLK